MRTDRQTGGRTDTHMTKLVAAFRNSANAPNNLVTFYSSNRKKPINKHRRPSAVYLLLRHVVRSLILNTVL
jgi:hypothetical protein